MGYQAKTEVAAFEQVSQTFLDAANAWEETCSGIQASYDQAEAQYQSALASWSPELVDEEGNPIPQPQPPPAPSFPAGPSAPPTPFVFSSREVADNELVVSEYGEILVIAPKTILTGANGFEFALDADTLARDYVEVVDA